METKKTAGLEEKYLLGIPEIDAQHRELADLVAKFKASIERKDQRHLIHPVLRRLYHLLLQHFTYEESLMDMIGYAELAQHRKTHQGILRLLNDYLEHPVAPSDHEYFSNLIGDKVLAHLMEHDVQMIDAIKEKLPALPRPPEAAIAGD